MFSPQNGTAFLKGSTFPDKKRSGTLNRSYFFLSRSKEGAPFFFFFSFSLTVDAPVSGAPCLDSFGTAVTVSGKIPQIPSRFPPKRDCGTITGDHSKQGPNIVRKNSEIYTW